MQPMSFGVKFVGAMAALFLVAACATKDTTPVDESAPAAPVADSSPVEAAPTTSVEVEPMDTGPAQDTQEYLVANIGDRVHFDYDQFDLSAEARDILRRQADWMITNGGVRVSIEGHCDERGTREYNLALGDRRATAIKNYLVALGVDGSRVQTISYGKERPQNPGSNNSAWAENRRGVMVVS